MLELLRGIELYSTETRSLAHIVCAGSFIVGGKITFVHKVKLI